MSKIKYEPPVVRDLSSLIARGDEPGGVCTAGYRPYEECVAGPWPYGQNPPCNPGALPDAPMCSIGDLASSTCFSGARQAG
jgi:hypothetical protein